jgi:hypothetical protein
MKTNRTPHLAVALTCALAAVTAARAADATAATTTTEPAPAMTPAAADADGWKFAATLPLWAPQINGNVTIRGQQKDVNVNFNDLRDHLDASLSLAFNAQKGKFGLFGNFGYMKFSGGFADAAGGQTDAKLKFLVSNAGLSYQLVRTESEHPFILAGTAGVRYWYVSTTITHHDGFGTRDFSGYQNYNLFDPVLGLRASQYITRKLHLDVAGDGGGFDINHDTDWTWSVSGMLTYDFTSWFSASAGYQALAVDESTGSGKNEKGLNLIFSGVAAGLTFKF